MLVHVCYCRQTSFGHARRREQLNVLKTALAAAFAIALDLEDREGLER